MSMLWWPNTSRISIISKYRLYLSCVVNSVFSSNVSFIVTHNQSIPTFFHIYCPSTSCADQTVPNLHLYSIGKIPNVRANSAAFVPHNTVTFKKVFKKGHAMIHFVVAHKSVHRVSWINSQIFFLSFLL